MSESIHPSVCVVLLLAASTLAAAPEAHDKHYNLGSGALALSGYDPVSYFGTPKPSAGDPNITAEVDGVVYRFASDANRAAFRADPGRYMPAYGGWCATAMAYGKKVQVNPRNYRVTGGRLFLFYKDPLHDAQDDWKKDEAGMRAKADDNWRKISGERPVPE
jgi:YHS domain-containing protein